MAHPLEVDQRLLLKLSKLSLKLLPAPACAAPPRQSRTTGQSAGRGKRLPPGVRVLFMMVMVLFGVVVC